MVALDARELLGSLTGAPECAQFGIVGGSVVERVDPDREIFARQVTYEDGGLFLVTVEAVKN